MNPVTARLLRPGDSRRQRRERRGIVSLVDAFLLEGYQDPREFWIADRADAIGSGTQADPFSGARRYSPPVLLGSSDVSSSGTNKREASLNAATALGLVNGDVVCVSGVTGLGAEFWNGCFPVYEVLGNAFSY